MSWDVDGVRITRVVEHVMPFTVDFFAEATPADVASEAWLAPDFVDAEGRYLMSFHSFVLETGARRIVVDTVAADTVLTRDVHLGRTPGHLSVWIRDRCVITGDALHHPIQCRHPEWTARGGVDKDQARATRRTLLAAAAGTNALVLGTHFAGTGAGRVLPAGDGYRFVPEPRRSWTAVPPIAGTGVQDRET